MINEGNFRRAKRAHGVGVRVGMGVGVGVGAVGGGPMGTISGPVHFLHKSVNAFRSVLYIFIQNIQPVLFVLRGQRILHCNSVWLIEVVIFHNQLIE